MTAKGYATASEVAAHLGVTFTAAQITEANLVIEAAEQWIDGYTGVAWMGTSPVTRELHALEGPLVYLYRAPVSAISAVAIRSSAIGGTESALSAGASYELLDATNGILRVTGYSSPVIGDPPTEGYLVFVTYTFSAPAPAAVALAAKMLVGHWMRPTLGQGGDGIQSYSIAGDLSVSYEQETAKQGVPAEVKALLARYRQVVFA